MADNELIIRLAKAAGLDRAIAEFPDDVRAAAEQALRQAAELEIPADPAAEPWPPMRAGTAG